MKRRNISIFQFFSFLIFPVLLSGCALYGKYERPTDKLTTAGIIRDPVAANDTLQADATQPTFGQMPWRELFTDPILQGHIDKALRQNTDLLNAIDNVKQAEAYLTVARLAFVPSLAIAPSGTISRVQTSGAETNKTYQLPISASWNLDLFGNLLGAKRTAQSQLLMAKDYQVAVQTQIVCGIANSYYTLMMLDRQLEIVTGMEQLVKETWDMMALQQRLGRARSTSVQSAEANYYSVKAQAADIRRQIRETENAFCLLQGEAGHQVERSTLDRQQLPQQWVTGVGLQLLDNRADVHAAEMQLAQCFYGIKRARSRFFPSINITATGTFTNSLGGAVVNPGKFITSLVGSLTQPIFANGQLIAGLKVAKLDYDKALNTFQTTVLRAGNEVSNALVAYNTAKEKADLENRQVLVLTQNVEDTKKLYKNSGSSYLEVISAESQLLSAQLSKVADDFYTMQAIVTLYQALGGGGQ
ncbi:MAG: efflux transporter outer membrane subunit [Prevotella sp.]|nr:efflux transporter outer membrane subunit [Prevotella sp.]